jgi:hypothetical protein
MNTSHVNRHVSLTNEGPALSARTAPSEAQLSLARAAEVQGIQERQMLLQTGQYNLAAGLHDLLVGVNTVTSLSPLLSQLLPHEQEMSARHIEAIRTECADGFVTTTTLEFFVEDVR